MRQQRLAGVAKVAAHSTNGKVQRSTLRGRRAQCGARSAQRSHSSGEQSWSHMALVVLGSGEGNCLLPTGLCSVEGGEVDDAEIMY